MVIPAMPIATVSHSTPNGALRSVLARLRSISVTITTIAMLPGPECSLRGTVIPGSNFRLETSTDLVHWTAGATVVAAPDGSFECHLPAPTADPARFYRLRSP